MKKITFAKSNGVDLDSIVVPVNFMWKECKVMIPFIFATKIVQIGRRKIDVSYKRFISDEVENAIIKYYNDVVFLKAFVCVAKKKENAILQELKKINIVSKSCLYLWISDAIVSLGFTYNRALQAERNYCGIDNIINDLLKEQNEDELYKWVVDKCNEIVRIKKFADLYNGYYDNEDDVKLLEGFDNETFWSYAEKLLTCEKYRKLFVKGILIPYLKEEKENERIKQEKIKKCYERINEGEKMKQEALAELKTYM